MLSIIQRGNHISCMWKQHNRNSSVPSRLSALLPVSYYNNFISTKNVSVWFYSLTLDTIIIVFVVINKFSYFCLFE